MDFDYQINFIIIGESSVGKTNILLRYTKEEVTLRHDPTLGMEFGYKMVNFEKLRYKVRIWDTAGSEKFRSIILSYFNNAACALVVYDISVRDSFESVEYWVDLCHEKCPSNAIIILVGNKTDLVEERKVSYKEGEEYAKEKGILFFECSAKTGDNINDIFNAAISAVHKEIKEGLVIEGQTCGITLGCKSQNISLNEKKEKKKKCFDCK